MRRKALLGIQDQGRLLNALCYAFHTGYQTPSLIKQDIRDGIREGSYPKWMVRIPHHNVACRLAHLRQSGVLKSYVPLPEKLGPRPNLQHVDSVGCPLAPAP